MKRICAWCQQDLEPAGFPADTGDYITHGICKSCYNILLLQLGVDVHRYLDSIDAPIVLIDSQGTVKTANAMALSLLNKKSAEVDGHKNGEIFECPYSKLPEGCGKTRHCAGCTIKNTVMETYATGKGALRTPVVLNQKSQTNPQKVNMFISTEKVGQIVFMRIDEMEGRISAPSKT